MKKLILALVVISLGFAGIMIYNFAHNITGPTPTSAPWAPARLQIPAIHVDASVMGVGQTSSGAMDAPLSKVYNSPYWSSVFWYDVGAPHGHSETTVLAGL